MKFRTLFLNKRKEKITDYDRFIGKWAVLLNAPVMKEIAIRKGRHRKKVLHNVAHEFGHVIGDSSDKEANRLAKEWGFVP